MNPITKRRILNDLTSGGRTVEQTADQARALKEALLNATRENKELYTTRPNWENGHLFTAYDAGWIKAVLVSHGVSVPGSTEPKYSKKYAVRYDFMPYTISGDGAPDMACKILKLEIPAPRDPLLPPPGLTTEEVLDRIIDMTKKLSR